MGTNSIHKNKLYVKYSAYCLYSLLFSTLCVSQLNIVSVLYAYHHVIKTKLMIIVIILV